MSVTFASRPAVNGVVGAGRNAVSYVVQRLAGLQRLSWRPQLRPAFFRRSDLRNAHIIEFRRSDPHFSAVPTGATPTSSNSAAPTRVFPPLRLAQRPHHRIPPFRPAFFRHSNWRNAHIIEFRRPDLRGQTSTGEVSATSTSQLEGGAASYYRSVPCRPPSQTTPPDRAHGSRSAPCRTINPHRVDLQA